ncbi:hypothetical protein [Streptodolium elevatio]
MRITRSLPTRIFGELRPRPKSVPRVLSTLLPVAVVLVVGGCSSDDGDGSDKAARTPAGTASGLSDDERSVKYAECLRENGLDVADPLPGQSVQLRIDSGTTDMATVGKAKEACRTFSPPQSAVAPGGQGNPAGQEFAACMRDRGVEAFPDPDPNQQGVRMSGEVQKDPDFEKAAAACQPIFSGGQAGQGQG